MDGFWKVIRLLMIVISAFSLVGYISVTQAQTMDSFLTRGYAPGEVIVKFKPGLKRILAKPEWERIFTGIPSIDSLNVRFRAKAVERVFRLKEGRPMPRGFLGALPDLANVYKIKLPEDSDVEAIVAAYARDPNVEYAQPNYLRRLCVVPDDSLYWAQWALQRIAASSAWELERGKSTVIMAFIDTGIDYTHPDLADNIWYNLGEIPDNGVDDDNNGYVDDIRGWDFTDAPGTPGLGDYLEQDNDPMDDVGHGTHVAGIAGAVTNNNRGIAGVTWYCKLMAVRAGYNTALGGFLEDDDAAGAIVYAADNGAQVINMSWGAPTPSPIIRDAVAYAYSLGCVLVAAAGNDGTEGLYYPAAHDQVLAVGASDFSDFPASFSNYGWDLDVIAPGVGVESTWPDSSYNTLSGTSMATPHVVGLAALVLSHHPDFTPEEVRQVVRTSAKDLFGTGWDKYSGSGRINLYRALQVERVSQAAITSPHTGDGVEDSLVVTGTASGVYLDYYTLDYGIGDSPTSWTRLTGPVYSQAIDETLATLEVSTPDFPETTYTLKLRVTDLDGSGVEDRVVFQIGRSRPVISDVTTPKRLDGDRYAQFVECRTDQTTRAELLYRSLGDTGFSRLDDPNLGQEHSLELSQEVSSGRVEFYLRSTNPAGLADSTALDTLSLDPAAIATTGFAFQDSSLPMGYLLPQPTDFDQDGKGEMVLTDYPGEGDSVRITYGPVKIYEWDNGSLPLAFTSSDSFLPRDWGDADGDGKLELLGVNAGRTWLYEAPDSVSFPSQRVWEANGLWGSAIVDSLDGDERGEIVGVSDGSILVYENTGGDSYSLVATLENPTQGAGNLGATPVVGDFDGDGRREILAGDSDGDLFIYETNGNNSFVYTWSDSLPLPNTTYLAAGDLDGDGIDEFAVAGNLTEVPIPRLTRWMVAVYDSVGNNNYSRVWSQEVLGVEVGSGITIGDVDGDGIGEVVFCARPDLYLFNWETSDSLSAMWYSTAGLTYRPFAGDLEGDGTPEIALIKGQGVYLFEWEGPVAGPSVPTGLVARPLDATRVRVSWNQVAGVDGYRLYRGLTADSLSLLQAVLTETAYTDTGLTSDSTYWYAVASVCSGSTSARSTPVSARPNPPPRVVADSARYVHPRHVVVRFSEPMGASIQQPGRYQVDQGVGSPVSVVVTRGGREAILGFAQQLPESTLTVTVRDVEDSSGVPIDTTHNWASFLVDRDKRPYLKSVKYLGEHEVKLTFNDPMDTSTTEVAGNYTILPRVVGIVVESALVDPDSLEVVRLRTGPSPFGAIGYVYTVVVSTAIKNVAGAPIQEGKGDRLSFQLVQDNLDQLLVFPNPYREGGGVGHITFANLTPQATIRIFTLAGEPVRTLKETDGNGGLQWDLTNEYGRRVASGIYLYYVEGNGDTRRGKLAIIR